MRLFVGIPLAPEVVNELSTVSMRLRSPSDGLRWSASESWHITLQFLGNTAEYASIVTELAKLTSPPVLVQLESLGFFDRAGVFFAGVKLSPGLEILQQRVTAATAHCGFIPETRPYHPHITLARSKSKGHQALRALKAKLHREPKFSAFLAERFVLYESKSGANGSHYEVKEQFKLCPT